ncbi:hypothetical protein HYFRA_00004462 [Hymenoscyphus fraxineus]|uniref:Uncharacterized protein n=1 Tax=Hymenoscyphus fraxineus TaxID=746836 RepID=A0A9N9PPE6_9HELO|nr:hypothetical protein HYFRA_00004462 [Hymenoscyphus fraxineus]
MRHFDGINPTVRTSPKTETISFEDTLIEMVHGYFSRDKFYVYLTDIRLSETSAIAAAFISNLVRMIEVLIPGISPSSMRAIHDSSAPYATNCPFQRFPKVDRALHRMSMDQTTGPNLICWRKRGTHLTKAGVKPVFTLGESFMHGIYSFTTFFMPSVANLQGNVESFGGLSFMGQDRVYLQVVVVSGTLEKRRNAQKVLDVLNRGKHWVLVTLLLGKVTTNETLPITLDHGVKGGWIAFSLQPLSWWSLGKSSHQICSLDYVLYFLFPLAHPTAKLLDFLLGDNHGIVFSRSGLKSLVMLHEHVSLLSTEPLYMREVSMISNIHDLRDRRAWSIMTPMPKDFTLEFETLLNSRCEFIPVCSSHTKSLAGSLIVTSLFSGEEVDVEPLAGVTFPAVRAETCCLDMFSLLEDWNKEIIIVSDDGTFCGTPFGIITAKALLEVLIRNGES